MLVVEDRVGWTVENGTIYHLLTTGGSLTTIAVGEDAGRACVVLPDRLLVNLGFASDRAIRARAGCFAARNGSTAVSMMLSHMRATTRCRDRVIVAREITTQ